MRKHEKRCKLLSIRERDVAVESFGYLEGDQASEDREACRLISKKQAWLDSTWLTDYEFESAWLDLICHAEWRA